MSTLSLDSSASDGASSTPSAGLGNGDAEAPVFLPVPRYKENMVPFDKCPRCRVQFDFIKRNNATKSVSKVPLILTCNHTICEDCIFFLCREKHTYCPVCNATFVVPRTLMEAGSTLTDLFNPHFTLIGQLVWMKNGANRRTLTMQPSGFSLAGRQLRQRESPEGEHSVDGSGDRILDGDVGSIALSLEFDKCSEHKDGILNIYCQDCSETVCIYCFVDYHGGHSKLDLYKLSQEEMEELFQFKGDMELLLKHLQSSQKKTTQLSRFDLTSVEGDIKRFFADLHAKLHIAERNLNKKLHMLKVDETDLKVVNTTLRSGITKVQQALKAFEMMNSKQFNVRALFEEVKTLRKFPCRLVSDHGALDPIEFQCMYNFDNIEECFALKKSAILEYSLLPVDDWTNEAEIVTQTVPKEVKAVPPKLKIEAQPQETFSVIRRENSVQKVKPSEAAHMQVIVTHINNLDSFFVQKVSSREELDNMNRFIEKREKKRVQPSEILTGHVVSIYCKYSQKYRRGKVLDIISKEPDTIYKIYLMDYGNIQTATADKLRVLDTHLAKRPAYAFECKLINPDDITYDSNDHIHLSQIITQKQLYLKTVRKVRKVQEVDLLIRNSNGDLVSVRNILFKKKSPSATKEDVIPKQFKLFKNSKRFSLGQEEYVRISYLKDPSHICVQMAQNVDAINKMRNEMGIFYENQRDVSCIPVEDTDVVVKYDHISEGKWHRCRITAVNPTNQTVNVYFVDWGGNATVSWSQVLLLSEKFTVIECQAIKVKLAHIQPENVEGPWPEEVIYFLKDLSESENNFKLLVSEVDPLEVALFQCRPAMNICVNSLLVERRLAISTGSLSESVYWPNDESAEIEPDDNDFSFQMVKKCEEIVLQDDDNDLNKGIKKQIHVIHFKNPELIFIKLAKDESKEEELQKELQIHYSIKHETKTRWQPSEYCVVHDSIKNAYFRGVIKAASGPDAYIVYLYDHVRDLKVPRQKIYVLDPYFKKYRCNVLKCRLSNIKPAGDRGTWSNLAIEILQKIFGLYKIIHIKKVGARDDEKVFDVLMWYSLTAPAKALEPTRFKFVQVNKLLVETGVAFSAGTPMGSIGSTDCKTDDTNTNSEKEDGEKVEKAKNDDKKDWYQLICEDEAMEESVLQSWPDPEPLQKKQFNAVLTCVSLDDEVPYLAVREEDMHALYVQLEENLNKTLMSHELVPQIVKWQPKEMCTIFYQNGWYRGTVLDIKGPDEISVEMIDYGSEHVVSPTELFKEIMYPDIPPLINKLKLYDVHTTNFSWNADDIDKILQIVTESISVTIKGPLDCELPMAEIYLENGLSLNDIIIQKIPRLVRYESKITLGLLKDIESDDTTDEIVSSNTDTEPVTYNYVPFPQLRNFKGKMFIVNIFQWDCEFSTVLNVKENNSNLESEDFMFLTEEIQSGINKQPALKETKLNAPCVCFHEPNNVWGRAIVYKDDLESGYVLVFFVDYGTIDMVKTDSLKQMKEEWFSLPVSNRIAKINIKVVQANKADNVSMRLQLLRGKFAVVEVVSENPLAIHLYSSSDNKLCYQNFLDNGVLKTT